MSATLEAVQLEDFYIGDKISVRGQVYYVDYWHQASRTLDISGRPCGGMMMGNLDLDNEVGYWDVKLLRRGNVFRRRFGLELLPFANYSEEANFWRQLGMLEQARKPSDGYYDWSLEEALVELEKGTIDVFSGSSGGPGVPFYEVFYSAWRVTDPEAGARLRATCLAELKSLAS